MTENFESGVVPGSGTFFCVQCGSQLSLLEDDVLPECRRCGSSAFALDSIFESMQDHGGAPTTEFAIPKEGRHPAWLHEARIMLPGAGRYLAHLDGEEVRLFEIGRGWTRIGRSVAADIRLDDPSVSRRHALIVSESPKGLRVLDDRSLNGVFLNGKLIEWCRLGDGDELKIGRFRLFALEA